MKKFDHAACLRSLELVCRFFEKRLAAREASPGFDKELIESTRLDVKELRQLRRWCEKNRYVTAVRYWRRLDSYLRDYIPHRTVNFMFKVGWRQFNAKRRKNS